MPDLNVALKTALVHARKSQVRLRQETGITEWRLSRIVNGHLTPRYDEQRRIARALKRPIGELFPADHPHSPMT